MPYNIRYSDSSNTPISVADGDLNQETSLTFIGKNYNQSYSGIIGENFLHLLENFASPYEPLNKTKGQLWYNSEEDYLNKGLKIYDGSNWRPLGEIRKGEASPPSTTLPSSNGDLYVDTARQQLWVRGDKDWQLIGPKYQLGDKTTAELEGFIDSLDATTARIVLTLFVNNNRVAIISDKEFTPKTTIEGFTLIKQGITLSTTNFQSNSKINKFWGVSEKAEALIIDDAPVNAVNFLRSDTVSTTNQTFNIKNNNGLSIGEDLTLNIGLDFNTNSSVIYNRTSGSNINFRLVYNNQTRNVMTIDSRSSTLQRGSVGINNTAPTESLDVIGNIKTNQSLIITGDKDSTVSLPDYPALSVKGGGTISRSLIVGTNLTVNGTSEFNNNIQITGKITVNKSLNSQSILEPITLSGGEVVKMDIGTSSKPFDNIYATNFRGKLTGEAEKATYIRDGITINIGSNDINARTVTIGTSLSSLTGNLDITLNSRVILTKPSPDQVSLSNNQLRLLDSDLLLVSRKSNSDPANTAQTLIKLTGEQAFGSFKDTTINIGSIILWKNITTIPKGYVLCDGRSMIKSDYQVLFERLYSDVPGKWDFIESAIQKFRVPDLRSVARLTDGIHYIIYAGNALGVA